MSATPQLLEEERQFIMMALANLAVERPSWMVALRDIAMKYDGMQMFEDFVTHRVWTHPALGPR